VPATATIASVAGAPARATATSGPGQPPSATFPARIRPIVRATDLGSVAVLRHGALALLADPFGDIRPDSRGLGLYHGDTRVLSTLALRFDGLRPTLLEGDAGGSDGGVIQLTNPELHDEPGRLPEDVRLLPTHSLGIRRERHLSDDGLVERVSVANYTLEPHTVCAELLLDADGADIFEVRGYARERRGQQCPVELTDRVVTFRYRGLDEVELRTSISFEGAPDEIEAAPVDADGAVAARWHLSIPPGATATIGWGARPSWDPADAPARAAEVRATDGRAAGRPGNVGALAARPDPTPDTYPDASTTVETDDELVNLILARGASDIRLLETEGPGRGERFVAAGVPWFAALFGRDALLASLFMLPVRPELARTTLEVLARRQAGAIDDWRDAEPGKILHELRTGEMARTGELPFTPYYGSVDATPLWLMLLAETHAWTADDALVDRLWPTALAALGWLEQHGDLDGDDLVEYARRSERGLRNQGWKDSHDSVRDRQGALAEGAVALIEVQGYAIAARRGLARLAVRRGEVNLAARLEADARRIQEVVERAFWIPALDRYAMALDGGKRPMDALASNMGHGLWTGTVDPARARAVARDLLGPSLFSGWGIRTLGSDQAGYNPLGYHTGTVWPHDTAIAIGGLKRYGFHEEAATLGAALLDAARNFPLYRFPELFCGFDREHTRVPVAYPVACAPQAWAAAAPFHVFRALLGLEADAPFRTLRIVRPILPRPIQKLVLTGLRVGDASVDLLFHRWRGTTSAEVLRRSGDLEVVVHL
jgi:glycogen debranching enzyme